MPIVDVQFKITGKMIPVDNGYRLYSALSKLIPQLHDFSEIGIHPISGILAGNRCLAISDKSLLTFRLSTEQIPLFLPLAGKTLSVGEYQIHVGIPQTRALVPAARLYSRLVVIKGFLEAEPFLEAAYRQLHEFGIKGKLHLIEQSQVVKANEGILRGSHSQYLRRTIRIRDKEVVGFGLRAEELTAEESIILQEKGIGGRRRFGCGIFVPDRR